MAPDDIRWKQRFANFCKALARLSDAVALEQERPLSDLEKQGVIQAFEFTHELAWNTLKDFLVSRGNTEPIYGSRDATREAFAAGLIENGECWMEMILDRNRSSHTYDPQTAEAVYQAATKRYHPEFLALQKKLTDLE
jgi:nucleotidyltransferase substrate binding protein (TIGR01987 family)